MQISEFGGSASAPGLNVLACFADLCRRLIESRVCWTAVQAASGFPQVWNRAGTRFGIIMKIHEYQGKAILKKYGVAVPRGMVAATREEAEAAAQDLLGSGATGVVVKAQIHAGGRGKGGGVKIAKSVDEAGEIAGKMLGMKLITHQTGPEGRVVRRLLVEETLPIEKELYLGIEDMTPILRALHKGRVIVLFAQRQGYLGNAEIPISRIHRLGHGLRNAIRGNVLQLEVVLQADPAVAFGGVTGSGCVLF